MANPLKIRLHLVIPTVENAIAGNAFRPGDVLRSRKGLTVENTNTDAEARLILGDALTKAAEFDPELILDFATLPVASRVAIGPSLLATFVHHDALTPALVAGGNAVYASLLRMPLGVGFHGMPN